MICQFTAKARFLNVRVYSINAKREVLDNKNDLTSWFAGITEHYSKCLNF